MYDSGFVRLIHRAVLVTAILAAVVLGRARAALAIDVVAQGYSVDARGGNDHNNR